VQCSPRETEREVRALEPVLSPKDWAGDVVVGVVCLPAQRVVAAAKPRDGGVG